MSEAEQLRVAIFVSVVVLLYLSTAGWLVLWALARLRRQPISQTFTWTGRVLLLAAAIGLGCIGYGYFVEPYWPEVTHVRIETAKLPRGTEPIRIVHISDLHSDPEPRLEDELPATVAEQRPDLIVFTGDTINSAPAAPVAKRFFTELTRIAPVYVARGNWDVWYWSDVQIFDGTGVHVLNSAAETIEIRGVPIDVIGVAVTYEDRIPALLESANNGRFTVFLHHYPDEIESVSGSGKVDLYCAGHTHGGQVALPLYGALITLSKFGKRFEAGLYQVGETRLYVNRGIGMEGGPAPRVRFWARPEVTVLEIAPPSTAE